MKNSTKRKISYIILSVALLAFGAAVIIYPERYVNCCFTGFAMWAECVLPSLFPFMIITFIFVKTGIAERASLPLKRVTGKLKLPPAAAPCFVLSIFSGYPAGSRVIGEFYDSGALSKKDCEKLSYLCSTSGPLFIIGSVGYKMFGDKLAGLKILIAHIISITLVSVIVALLSPKSNSPEPRKAPADKNVLYNTFYGAIISVAVAGGFIAFFFVVAQFCADFNIFFPLHNFLSVLTGEKTASAVCLGLIEATTGCRALAEEGGKLQIALAGALITFGGLSILLQQLCYLTKSGIKPFKFIAVKFIQAAVCFIILLLIV